MSGRKIGIISGGFDPIHSGHISYLKSGSELVDELYVGCNTDAWLLRKKTNYFLPYKERSIILSSIKYVTEVIPFNDDDNSATNLIHKVLNLKNWEEDTEFLFLNGGDRTANNIPEMNPWKPYSKPVQFIFGVGGFDKMISSSLILSQYLKRV